MDFFDQYERQMADLPPRDPWHQAEVTAAAAYWCAVREADHWEKVQELWAEQGRLIDQLGRDLGLLPPAA